MRHDGDAGAARDAGLTVLETVVALAALGVLAVAAAPGATELRRTAWTTVAGVDARHAALLAAATEEGVAPAAPVLLSDPAAVPAGYADFRASAGVGTAVVGVPAGPGAPAGSCAASHHPVAGDVLHDSLLGPLRRDPATGRWGAGEERAPLAASAPCARLGPAGLARLLLVAGGRDATGAA
ncbi:hypothetical protein [Kineococcus sp. SYSU DK005]|uniref:hypothetical protein n=1 Tax=Kineococcus sp. SYSU DK005 TaxID=3383126 RepID=UPI003D7EDB11